MRTLIYCAKSLLLCGTALCWVLFSFSPAFAALGEDASSVQSDSARIKAAVEVVPGQAYSVHQMQLSTGTTVKEFISPTGQVFAVSWQGPYTPDLRQLLGRYFDRYTNAAQNPQRAARRMVHIETGDLVFESGGHMRFIVGRAYLRSKLPDGATPDVIH